MSNLFSALQYLLTEMAADGIEPDFLTIGSMVSAYADANQPRKAAAIMQDFLDSGGQVKCKAALGSV